MMRESMLAVCLVAVMTLTLPCTGFTAIRPINPLMTWDLVPTLDVENPSSSKSESTTTEKEMPTFEKKSTTIAEQTSPSFVAPEKRVEFKVLNPEEKRVEFKVLNPEEKPQSTKAKDETPAKETVPTENVSAPRNVVLIMTECDENQDDFWKYIKASHLFSTEGILQSGGNVQTETPRTFLNIATKPNQSRKRGCEHSLRTNIIFLLLWSRDVKGMTTGTLSNSNFTLPSLFGYEESVGLPKDLDDINEKKPEVHEPQPEMRSDWHMFDLEKPHYRNPFVPSVRDEDETALRALDMYSKIRFVLFRSLLESLNANATTTEETPAPSSHSFRLPRPNLVDLIQELKAVENEKGFILVASIGVSELNSALETLHREASQDTLVVVTGVCTLDAKPVPLAAQGPSAKMLQEVTNILDLPTVLKTVLATGCHDGNCKPRQQDDIFEIVSPSPKISPHNMENSRRFIREADKVAAKKADPAAAKVDDKKKDASAISADKTGANVNETDARSDGSSFGKTNRAEKFNMIFNIMLSISAAFVLTS